MKECCGEDLYMMCGLDCKNNSWSGCTSSSI